MEVAPIYNYWYFTNITPILFQWPEKRIFYRKISDIYVMYGFVLEESKPWTSSITGISFVGTHP